MVIFAWLRSRLAKAPAAPLVDDGTPNVSDLVAALNASKQALKAEQAEGGRARAEGERRLAQAQSENASRLRDVIDRCSHIQATALQSSGLDRC